MNTKWYMRGENVYESSARIHKNGTFVCIHFSLYSTETKVKINKWFYDKVNKLIQRLQESFGQTKLRHYKYVYGKFPSRIHN